MGELESVDDAIRVLFGLVVLDIKVGIHRASNLPTGVIDDIFDGDTTKPLGKKARFGVAAPEL